MLSLGVGPRAKVFPPRWAKLQVAKILVRGLKRLD
jgi:hypothetical protein